MAVALAERLGPAEIVNADSRQVLRRLHVATCAPGPDELRGVACHLLDLTDPGTPFSVADWLAAARPVLADLDRRGVRAILCGGTGLYVRALLDGYLLPGAPPPAERRAERTSRAQSAPGREALAAELLARDPAAGDSVDLRNPRRVIRALELLDAHPGPLAALRRRGPGREALRIGLDMAPELHRKVVESRSRRLLAAPALAAEIDAALAAGVSADVIAASGIGYREALELRAGRLDLDAAVAELTRRTIAYAKAQRTFFRGDPAVRWVIRETDEIEPTIDAAMALAAGVTGS